MDGECSAGHPKGPACENHINTRITIRIRKDRALQAFGREKANDEGLVVKSQQSCNRPKSRDHVQCNKEGMMPVRKTTPPNGRPGRRARDHGPPKRKESAIIGPKITIDDKDSIANSKTTRQNLL
jgi:hypothetical protein